MDNPRWPHKCKIYRMEGETSFDAGEQTILYEGECRKYSSGNLRTFRTENVVRSDYALSLPGIVCGILSGDCIDVEDRQGEYQGCMVVDCYAGNLGTTVFFNLPKN